MSNSFHNNDYNGPSFAKMVIVGAAIVGLLFAVTIGSWVLWVATAEIRGRGEAHVQINSAENRIAQYDYFFSLCGDVQSLEGSMEAQTQLLESQSSSVNVAQIEQSLAALQAERQRTIATYNNRASRDYTAGQFRDSDLPYQLADELYVVGEAKTVCASS